MPRREMHSSIKVVQHIAAAAYTTTQTPAAGVDLAGYNAAEIVVSIGTIANIANSPVPSWTFKLQESDEAASDFADVEDGTAYVVEASAKAPVRPPSAANANFLTVDGAAEDATTYRLGYIGIKRYIRVVATAADTPGATPLSVLVILGRPSLAPTAD